MPFISHPGFLPFLTSDKSGYSGKFNMPDDGILRSQRECFKLLKRKMTCNFFAYGTLMCEDILSAVIGSCLAGAKGKLNGYRRKTIKGEIYPGIVASPGEVIEGRIYKNLSAVAWKRLDLFEGHRYRRDFVEVELSRVSAEPAQTYALKPEFADRLSNEDWSFEEFLKYNKKNFEAKYIGFEILHQTKV